MSFPIFSNLIFSLPVGFSNTGSTWLVVADLQCSDPFHDVLVEYIVIPRKQTDVMSSSQFIQWR